MSYTDDYERILREIRKIRKETRKDADSSLVSALDYIITEFVATFSMIKRIKRFLTTLLPVTVA